MKVIRELDMLHPILIDCVSRIQSKVIDRHNMPFRLFETGRSPSRHQGLIDKGKTRDLVSRHMYDMDNDPVLYSTAVDYVHFNKRWSWNIRDSSVRQWYKLFGNLVLDVCPELEWGGVDRKSTNYNHFQLRTIVIVEHMEDIPCILP